MREIERFDEIAERLVRIEAGHNCRILYACESGSRAWGFPSTDSDYDVRFVYVRPREAYLRLDPPREVIEELDDALYDLSGWDLFKAAHLFRKTNPPLLEWLDSPIVYRDDATLAPALRAISAAHFNLRACAEHYLSMARSNWETNIAGRARVRKKKYLYALRPLFCVEWLLRRESMPPTAFSELMDGIDIAPELREAIDGLIESKRTERERDESERIAVFDRALEESPECLEKLLAVIPGRPVPFEPLNGVLAAFLH